MATVITIVNYDHIVVTVVNYDPKTFIVQATGNRETNTVLGRVYTLAHKYCR